MERMTYKKSGVDIHKAGLFKRKIRDLAKSSFRSEVLKDIGGFGSFFKLRIRECRDPVLVSSADGVGTKLKIANLVDRHDTIGIDAVAMNVNDILCTGAAPLFFLDYIAYSKVGRGVLPAIIKGLNKGCVEAGCSLAGGETAQMPGMYREGDYDLAGFCVGIVEETDIIDGSNIERGNTVIGLESSGLHSNGYSLVRKVLSKNELRRMSSELLKPTRIYVKPILDLLYAKRYTLNATIKGIAHITGGAFYDKIARILPANVNVRISKDAWEVPGIFKFIQNKGRIGEREMYHTFNMGIGLVLIVKPQAAESIIKRLSGFKLKSMVIGEVIKGNGKVEIN